MQDAVRSFPGPSYRSYLNLTIRDNLEFIQWIKRFWETNYPGHPYDPVARRKGTPMEVPATVAPIRSVPAKPVAKLTPGTRTPVSGIIPYPDHCSIFPNWR